MSTKSKIFNTPSQASETDFAELKAAMKEGLLKAVDGADSQDDKQKAFIDFAKQMGRALAEVKNHTPQAKTNALGISQVKASNGNKGPSSKRKH
jgi:hypothetical protein